LTFLKDSLAAFRVRHGAEIVLLWRFYKVAVVNTIFGYSVYFLLVFLGVNLYVAQILAQIAGVAFNYFTFTRHVFGKMQGSIFSFAGAYLLNYAVSLGLLALFHQLIASPYVAGLFAALGASLINFLVLRNFIFRQRRAGT
jgi:putative flippase GtrA